MIHLNRQTIVASWIATKCDIHHGDCRDVLSQLHSQSVNCCITSPPYWQLRDYRVASTIWGGSPSCQHDWVQWQENHDVREETLHAKSRTSERHYDSLSRRFNDNHQKHTAGTHCRHCHAWLGCLGLEPTIEQYVANLVEVFAVVWRVLRDDGTLWLNIGDGYNAYNGNRGPSRRLNSHHHTSMPTLPQGNGLTCKTLKQKDRILMPARVAIALQDAGWYVRDEIIWEKKNAMPSSVRDRTTCAHEFIFMLTKKPRYYYNQDAIREPASTRGGGASFGKVRNSENGDASGAASRRITKADRQRYIERGRNRRSVMSVSTRSFHGAHFAVFPPSLIVVPVLAGSPPTGTVLDPFTGSGTTALVSLEHGRRFIGVEANADYIELAQNRLTSHFKQSLKKRKKVLA